MKKTIIFLLAAAMTVSLAACKRQNKLINDETPIEQQTEFTLVGEWTIEKIETENSKDVLKKAVSNVLVEYFKEGMIISFKDDGTAECDGEAFTYTAEDGDLRMEWTDKTKNFNLKLSGDNSAVELNSNDIAFITLKKNK